MHRSKKHLYSNRLVGSGEQRLWDARTERLCDLEIDDQFEVCWSRDGRVSRPVNNTHSWHTHVPRGRAQHHGLTFRAQHRSAATSLLQLRRGAGLRRKIALLSCVIW
jgi:hypothetical protein